MIIPEWLGVLGAAVFVAIAVEHLRHLVRASGQRRSWHASHVLIAAGMAFMYAPRAIDPLAIPVGLWQLVFALAGVIAAVWALSGSERVPTMMWLLTAVDLGAMICMWSSHVAAPLRGLLLVYLSLQALLWAADAYRRLDGGPALIVWPAFTSPAVRGSAPSAAAVRATVAESLIGDLDLTLSMFAMAVGMAYMFVAMQLL